MPGQVQAAVDAGREGTAPPVALGLDPGGQPGFVPDRPDADEPGVVAPGGAREQLELRRAGAVGAVEARRLAADRVVGCTTADGQVGAHAAAADAGYGG